MTQRRALALGVFGALLTSSCVSCTRGEPVLELKANPRAIGRGGVSELRIVATDAQGSTGRGSVRLDAAVGVLGESSVMLDSFGSAATTFTCAEPACSGELEIRARWSSEGTEVIAKARVTVIAEVDAGSGHETTGPLAFPVGAIFTDRFLQIPNRPRPLQVLVFLSNLSACVNDPNAARKSLWVQFYDADIGVAPGTFPTNPSHIGPTSTTTYSEVEGLPDGGSRIVESAYAESGSCTLTRLGAWDGGAVGAIEVAGSCDVMVRLYDGGLVPVGASFVTNCGP